MVLRIRVAFVFWALAVPTWADDAVLVEVAGERYDVASVVAYLREAKPGLEFERLPRAEQERLIADFVDKKLLAREARKSGLDREPAVRARVDFFVDRVLAQELRERMQEAIPVTEDEIRSHYDEHRERFRIADRYHIEHLLYRRPESARWARDQLLAGKSWESLAAQKGADPNLAFHERKWLTPELLLPELVPAVRALEPGAVSEPVESSYGYHVLRLVAVEEGRLRPLDEVRERVVEQLRQRKTTERYRRMLETAREEHGVRLHLDALGAGQPD